jgi:hypothetical protein
MSDRFKPLSAQKLIRSRLKGTAQHIALALAGMTPPSGRLAITQTDLCSVVGVTDKTLRIALRLVEASGLLTVRRTLGASVYRWMPTAYADLKRSVLGPESDTSGEGAGSADGGSVAPSVVRRVVLDQYLRRREERYRIPASIPARIGQASWPALEARFVLLAQLAQRDGETVELALERVVRVGLGQWFARPGHNDFLVRQRHPLDRLVDDLDWLTGELRLASRREAKAPQGPEQSPPRPQTSKELTGEEKAEIARLKARMGIKTAA